MMKRWSVDVFECRGTPYEVGRQLAEGYVGTRGARARRPQGAARIRRFDVEDARRTLLEFAPNLWEELHGIADGLGMTLAEAAASFSNGRLAYPRRGCSAAIGNGLYARNYDFSPRRYDRALVAVQAGGVHASVGFADRYTGRLDGMNEKGLCAGLHFVDEAVAQPGLVSILIVRLLLDQCATVAEAIALLRRLPHGLAFNYSLADAEGEAAVVEAAPGRVAVRRGEALACTNHFQSPELESVNRPQIAPSRRRLPPLETWAKGGLAAAEIFRALNEARSPAFHHGYASGFGTLHTIVCEPAARRMIVGIGADAEPASIDVGAWARGAALGVARLDGRLGATSDKAFYDRDLAGAEFRNVTLAGARFDDIDFVGAEITANCNFKDMRLAGVKVEDLFAAWRRAQEESAQASNSER